jgi:hypothetical protein
MSISSGFQLEPLQMHNYQQQFYTRTTIEYPIINNGSKIATDGSLETPLMTISIVVVVSITITTNDHIVTYVTPPS